MFCFFWLRPPLSSTLFPYTTLFRSHLDYNLLFRWFVGLEMDDPIWNPTVFTDRKSTRLNSSHITISYAVFCLKKKMRAPLCQAQTSECLCPNRLAVLFFAFLRDDPP